MYRNAGVQTESGYQTMKKICIWIRNTAGRKISRKYHSTSQSKLGPDGPDPYLSLLKTGSNALNLKYGSGYAILVEQ